MNEMPEKYVVFDLEADNLLFQATKIHCIVMRIYEGALCKQELYYDYPISTVTSRPDGNIEDGASRLAYLASAGYTLVGHNICGYDFPLIHKLLGPEKQFDPLFNSSIIDTYIGVSLRFPEESAGLAHWGTKFGIPKPAHEDWSTLTDDMIHRCCQDVKINDTLVKHLASQGLLTKDFSKAIKLEQSVLYIHSQQVLHGLRVDIVQAKETIVSIDKTIDELNIRLHKALPTTVECMGSPVTKVFKADGTLTKQCADWFTKCALKPMSSVYHTVKAEEFDNPLEFVRVGGPFSRITFEPVNLNSHPKVKEVLLSLGWKPKEWNFKTLPDGTKEKTSPKLTEDSYDSLPEGVGQDLATYLKLCHRRRFILNENTRDKGLLSYIRSDGRIECDAYTCGTPTGRYRHTGAFVNLPRPSSFLGREIRQLFCVPYRRKLIGIDLSGIEARMMGHYASYYDKGAYAKKVLEGDIHTDNAKALGVSRDTAKTFLYAISYGAGNAKLSSILGCTTKVAKKKIESFWKENHGLRKLIDALQTEYMSKGYITGLDGRPLYIRGEHKLLNTLIQSAACVVFKHWMVRCWRLTQNPEQPVVCRQVLAYHDELAWEYYSDNEESAEDMAQTLVLMAHETGVHLGLTVDIDADYSIGTRYSEVH